MQKVNSLKISELRRKINCWCGAGGVVWCWWCGAGGVVVWCGVVLVVAYAVLNYCLNNLKTKINNKLD